MGFYRASMRSLGSVVCTGPLTTGGTGFQGHCGEGAMQFQEKVTWWTPGGCQGAWLLGGLPPGMGILLPERREEPETLQRERQGQRWGHEGGHLCPGLPGDSQGLREVSGQRGWWRSEHDQVRLGRGSCSNITEPQEPLVRRSPVSLRVGGHRPSLLTPPSRAL